MCKAQVANQQKNFVASVKTENYDLKNWHLIGWPGTLTVVGIIGMVVLAVWLKKKFASNCTNRRPRHTGGQEAPQEAPPMGAMRLNPRFALEYMPPTQPQVIPSTTMASQAA